MNKEMEERMFRPSSIEVSRNAKGQYSFNVKLYYDDELEDATEKAIKKMEETYSELLRRIK